MRHVCINKFVNLHANDEDNLILEDWKLHLCTFPSNCIMLCRRTVRNWNRAINTVVLSPVHWINVFCSTAISHFSLDLIWRFRHYSRTYLSAFLRKQTCAKSSCGSDYDCKSSSLVAFPVLLNSTQIFTVEIVFSIGFILPEDHNLTVAYPFALIYTVQMINI